MLSKILSRDDKFKVTFSNVSLPDISGCLFVDFHVNLNDDSKTFTAHLFRNKLHDPDATITDEYVLNMAWGLVEHSVEKWIKEVTVLNKLETRKNTEFEPKSNRIMTLLTSLGFSFS